MKAIYTPIFAIIMVYIFFLHNDGALFMQLTQYLSGEITDVMMRSIQETAQP